MNRDFRHRAQRANNSGDFSLVLGLLLVSGTAALGHEILWTRRMIDLLGASAEASARVFECFFLGLALGAATVSFVLPRVRRPWRALGWVELGVALFCLPALLIPEWTGWIWPTLGAERLLSWPGSVLKTVLSVLIILPPAILMGMTLPLAVSVLGGRLPDLPRREIWLYAVNTLGGVLGLALVVLLLLQWAGAFGSMLAMIALNLAVAAKCFQRHRRKSHLDAKDALRAETGPVSPLRFGGVPFFFAFFSGAGVLSLEVLGLAMANLAAPLAIYPQAGILLCVILLLAVAAAAVPKWVRRFGAPGPILPVCLAAAALFIAVAPMVFMALPAVRAGYFGYGVGFEGFLGYLAGVTFLVLGPAVLLAGTVFPLLISWPGKNDPLPERWLGGLLAVNGLGGIAGAEISYRLLLPGFGVHVGIGMIAIGYSLAAVGLVLAVRGGQRTRFLFPVATFLGVCCLVALALVKLPIFFDTEHFKLVDLRSAREGSLAVVESPSSGRAMIFDNQYLLAGSGSTPGLRRQAHLPLLFHPAPAKVAFIGLGTGITASGALEHAAVQSITAVELSRLVAAAAARDFGQFNHHICHDSRAQVHVEDARIYLEASPNQFDVVIGDLFTPWRPGEASLSGLEEFQAARRALRGGGRVLPVD